MQIPVPWTAERQQLLSDTEMRDLALERQRQLVDAMHRSLWLRAAQLVEEIAERKLHHALGHIDLGAWWTGLFPTSPYRLWVKLRNAYKAIVVAPRLAVLFEQGGVTLADLAAAGKLARHLHRPEDVEVLALDKSARRSMLVGLLRRPKRVEDLGPKKWHSIPEEFLKGHAWNRVLTAYRAWGRLQPGVSQKQVRRPTFARVLAWLAADWQRQEAEERARLEEVKP